jgi:cell division protein FtsB
MLDFQQKRKVKSFMYHKITIWVLLVLVLYTIYSTYRVYQKQKESDFLRGVAEKKVLELEERAMEIDNKIQDLDTKQGLEREIRSKFNVAKEDEKMIVILEEEKESSTTKKSTSSLWQKILDIFY